MPADVELCAIAALAYTTPATWCSGDVHATRTDADGVSVVAFRGTVPSDLQDWLRDLDCWPVWRRRLGWCHRGFITGAELLLPAIERDTSGCRIVLTGHSLGGALAIAAAALLTAAGMAPEAVVTFGAPRVGLWRLRRTLSGVPVRQYRDADDPVPSVPWPYLHVRRPLVFGRAELDPLAAHAVALYAARLAALAPV